MQRTFNIQLRIGTTPSFRHGGTTSRTHVCLHVLTRSRGTNLEPRAAQSTTLHVNQSIVFQCLSFTQGPIDALVGSTSMEKWGSRSERGTRGVTPERFGRCTSRERLRQHRLPPPLCILQSSPSAYPSRDNCRRHGDALLIGTRIIPLGEQIDPRIADRRTWHRQGPFRVNWRLQLENPPRMWCPVSVVLPTAIPHLFHVLQPAVVASYVGTVPHGSSMRLSTQV
jgi:hypothetical protein